MPVCLSSAPNGLRTFIALPLMVGFLIFLRADLHMRWPWDFSVAFCIFLVSLVYYSGTQQTVLSLASSIFCGKSGRFRHVMRQVCGKSGLIRVVIPQSRLTSATSIQLAVIYCNEFAAKAAVMTCYAAPVRYSNKLGCWA